MKYENERREPTFSVPDNINLEEFIKNSQPYLQLMSYYRCAIMEVETKLNVLNEEFLLLHDRNPISNIKSRLKTVRSIQNKLQKLELPFTLENIRGSLHDIAGVRVCCSFLDDVYMIAEALLRQDDITLIETKDYIAHPKPNGYRSLHLIISIPIFLSNETHNVEVEVQLRTISMDSWASLEHQLCYKKPYGFSEEMERELLRGAELSAELDKTMNDLQRNTFDKQEKEYESR